MKVTVDHREKADCLIECLKKNGHEVSIEELKVGDYLVDQALLIERKTLQDFANSIVDGRLFKQAARLVYQKMPTCLALEGTSRDLQEVNVSRASLQGALMTVSLVYGLPIIRSMNQEETASLIEMAADQLNRHRTGTLKRPGYRPKGARKQKLYFLQGLPGIGPDRAEQILDHFETIENLANAEYEDLLEVETIGPHTAQKIYRALREPPPIYHPNTDSFLSAGTDDDEHML